MTSTRAVSMATVTVVQPEDRHHQYGHQRATARWFAARRPPVRLAAVCAVVPAMLAAAMVLQCAGYLPPATARAADASDSSTTPPIARPIRFRRDPYPSHPPPRLASSRPIFVVASVCVPGPKVTSTLVKLGPANRHEYASRWGYGVSVVTTPRVPHLDPRWEKVALLRDLLRDDSDDVDGVGAGGDMAGFAGAGPGASDTAAAWMRAAAMQAVRQPRDYGGAAVEARAAAHATGGSEAASMSVPALDKWVLWIDCDALLMNHDLSLEWLLVRYGGWAAQVQEQGEALAGGDGGGSGSGKDFVIATFSGGGGGGTGALAGANPSSAEFARAVEKINSGVFLVRACEWSRGMLEAVWHQAAALDAAKATWRDQAAIIEALKADTEATARHVALVQPVVLNSFIPHPLGGYPRSYVWGDLVAHQPNCVKTMACNDQLRLHYEMAALGRGVGARLMCAVLSGGGSGGVPVADYAVGADESAHGDAGSEVCGAGDSVAAVVADAVFLGLVVVTPCVVLVFAVCERRRRRRHGYIASSAASSSGGVKRGRHD